MKKYLIILCLFLFFPLLTGAENDHLLIVEVQIAGEKANNDFIKIYNPTDSDLDISGYKLRKRSSTGGESSIRVFPEGSVIKTKDYFLWANSSDGYAVSISANTESTATLAKDNSVALLNSEGNIIEAVAWGISENPFVEGSPFPQNPDQNQKLERKKSDSIYEDSNNNSQDFYLNPPSQDSEEEIPPQEEAQTGGLSSSSTPSSDYSKAAPQNQAPKAQAGEDKIALVGQEIIFDGSLSSDSDNNPLTFFWNFGQGKTIQGAKATTTYPYPGQYIATLKVSDGSLENTDQILIVIYPTRVLVSEFLADPEGKDEEGEWLEIYNPSDFWVDLSGWQLDDKEGGSKPFKIPESTFIKSKSYLVFSREITKIALNNDTDEARILFPGGEISDALLYQDDKEGRAGARKGEDIFWTEVLTPGFANFIYSSSKENSNKESFLPLTNESLIKSEKNKKAVSSLLSKNKSLVVLPSLVDLDDLSLLGQTAQAAIISEEISKEIKNSADASLPAVSASLPAENSSRLTAGFSDKLDVSTLRSPKNSIIILLISVILSSLLFSLSLVSWRKKLKSKES
ncbi:MAG: hypothetical protein A3A94_00505 [Candidatus Portnoybacteria bacterium RIFCSPLOWO2_01_FULL_43_11]|uniref:PKD domain-containing protein n=4 Tax=Candidatus Portnoyibacteriota TaxID=1817913 RepID=A0A1G2FCQ3_9BACT|nr:MAG: hypothetical protein A2815_01730 [Candidatus Portnoybacteria bacterium RIFCSPHIGHO2_01_FULL_40_12b]OGZ39044.1 MAG: hypothetical protein A3E90_01370 [Candidatus Portnoybacteria bacterium RIFCSPHIGHO2_12_FULL_40_11]OGZ39217.1 MAG: hypothetical protein A3A94_00505 [Candidatus Portnoybacteria bacterium RIFCSPLOWO2_01_FULL_43_11]OGZ39754.1 MAG: hypothetical protein A3I20_03110 [Candidatus Portnoybacteria bacterium RIFCSPLOWO2_02_FULL_40_15]